MFGAERIARKIGTLSLIGATGLLSCKSAKPVPSQTSVPSASTSATPTDKKCEPMASGISAVLESISYQKRSSQDEDCGKEEKFDVRFNIIDIPKETINLDLVSLDDQGLSCKRRGWRGSGVFEFSDCTWPGHRARLSDFFATREFQLRAFLGLTGKCEEGSVRAREYLLPLSNIRPVAEDRAGGLDIVLGNIVHHYRVDCGEDAGNCAKIGYVDVNLIVKRLPKGTETISMTGDIRKTDIDRMLSPGKRVLSGIFNRPMVVSKPGVVEPPIRFQVVTHSSRGMTGARLFAVPASAMISIKEPGYQVPVNFAPADHRPDEYEGPCRPVDLD
jgi:hypothetical protein